MNLENKVALVVGSTSGIGRGIAKRFAKEGALVIVSGRRADKGKAVAEEIQAAGGKAEFMRMDARVDADQSSVLKEIIRKYGKLDILAYNAGIGPMHDLNVEEKMWDDILNTNMKGAFFMAQKAIPELKKTKGRILFTTSLAGFSSVVSDAAVAYGTSKAGLMHVTKIIARQVAKDGICVNAISPGLIKTDILNGIPDEIITSMTNVIPLKRIGLPDDIANTAAFLVSGEASYITGQIVSVCGGYSDL